MDNKRNYYRYTFSDDPELQKVEREFFGDNAKGSSKHYRYWVKRTVVFHYSNGTNKCSVEGCDAEVHQLTLEHNSFDVDEMNKRLGIKSRSGTGLARALLRHLTRNLPDEDISIKCFKHNMQNQHPEHAIRTSKALSQNRSHIDPNYKKTCACCGNEKLSTDFGLDRKSKDGLHYWCKQCGNIKMRRFHATKTIQAYQLLGFDTEGKNLADYSFSHTLNDGHLHRKRMMEMFNLTKPPGGHVFARYLIKEYELGLEPWPGLKVESLNNQLDYRKRNRNENTN